MSLSGYHKHKETQAADAPLSQAEVELKEVKQVCPGFKAFDSQIYLHHSDFSTLFRTLMSHFVVGVFLL